MIGAILIATLDAQIAALSGELFSLQACLLGGAIEGGEALAVAGVLLELHNEIEAQQWALKTARALLAFEEMNRC